MRQVFLTSCAAAVATMAGGAATKAWADPSISATPTGLTDTERKPRSRSGPPSGDCGATSTPEAPPAAIISAAKADEDMKAGAFADNPVEAYAGIRATALSAAPRERLLDVIEVFVQRGKAAANYSVSTTSPPHTTGKATTRRRRPRRQQPGQQLGDHPMGRRPLHRHHRRQHHRLRPDQAAVPRTALTGPVR
jgi:hypothetical protein